VHFSHKYFATGVDCFIVLLEGFIGHIINNFATDFNIGAMSFWSDKITSFSGNTPLRCGKNMLKMDKPLVMGILNLTPDSFYDGGQYLNPDAWMAHTEKMIDEGASIIDVGAVSTRPGSTGVSENEEIDRLIPVIDKLTCQWPGIVFSVDTFRSEVARLAYEAGAGIINDVSAGSMDRDLLTTVAATGLPYVVMHMQGNPSNMQVNPAYADVCTEVGQFFNEKIIKVKDAGIEQVILDPGFGFGKSIDHNYRLLRKMYLYKETGYPLLVGLSRKSMIYKLLDITPDEALPATTALNMLAVMNGADILRVHDVKEAVQAIKLAESFTKAAE